VVLSAHKISLGAVSAVVCFAWDLGPSDILYSTGHTEGLTRYSSPVRVDHTLIHDFALLLFSLGMVQRARLPAKGAAGGGG